MQFMAVISLPKRASRLPLLLLVASVLILAYALAVRLLAGAPALLDEQSGASRRALLQPSTEAAIAQYQGWLRVDPANPHLYAQLGLLLLQRVRENGDVALYAKAETAFDEALRLDPNEVDALQGQGMLALARHDFPAALEWADRAWAINPFRAAILGIRVDALVELGRYPEAVDTLQQMVDLRPDLAAYTRVSYLRELHGRTDSAIEAMRRAAQMGLPGDEGTLWTLVQLGHLHRNQGDLDRAEEAYRAALAQQSGYVHAQAGMASVWAAHGRVSRAIDQYLEVSQRLPLPEYLLALGELYESQGRVEEARRQFELIQVIQQLNGGAGTNVDLELAWFNADHGDPALALAQAQATYAARPTIFAADALAWALYRNGHAAEAAPYAEESLRLGTRDARLHFHAGMIAYANGDEARARELLRAAIAINPHFAPIDVPVAESVLAQLGARP